VDTREFTPLRHIFIFCILEFTFHCSLRFSCQAYGRGSWTARTSIPTPIGIMFHNSDLNHYGYSLNRTSLLLCEGVSSSPELDKECLTSKENADKFAWDKRDFSVDVSVVMEFVKRFVLESEHRCNDLIDELERKFFVMYNVWCRNESSTSSDGAKLDLRHFYR
jgi:hypothetical protein